jgi:hypothetical protein
MRSPGSGARRAAEWALRAAVIGVLAFLVWRSGAGAAPRGRSVARGGASEALARWSTEPAADTLHLALDAAPTPRDRAWLRALGAAGATVAWSADSALPMAVALEPEALPGGGARLRVAAPPGTRLRFADDAGALGELTVSGAGATAELSATAGTVAAFPVGAPRRSARVLRGDSIAVRRVLVLGRAAWETKFVVAALEEAGWAVETRAPVAPGVIVRQGALSAPDTTTHSAVVVLDSTAASYATRIARFVRQGGGVVLAGDGATLGAFAGIAPGAGQATAQAGVAGALASAEPRRGLRLQPVARLRADALPLERRAGTVAAAARRVGAGRVVQLGYAETWRWRMLGAEAAPEAHRAWWSRVVGSVAYAPVVARDSAPARAAAVRAATPAGANVPVGGPPRGNGAARGRAGATSRTNATAAPSAADTLPDDAPYARAVAVLGPPSPIGEPPAAPRRPGTPWWLFPLLAAALLAEWASRRFRGAR